VHQAAASLCAALMPGGGGVSVGAGGAGGRDRGAPAGGGTLLLVSRAADPVEVLRILKSRSALQWTVTSQRMTAEGEDAVEGQGVGYTCTKLPQPFSNAECASGRWGWSSPGGGGIALDNRCSFSVVGKSAFAHDECYECLDCGLDLMCPPCATTCHAGHDVRLITRETAVVSLEAEVTGFCDCGWSGFDGGARAPVPFPYLPGWATWSLSNLLFARYVPV